MHDLFYNINYSQQAAELRYASNEVYDVSTPCSVRINKLKLHSETIFRWRFMQKCH